MRRHLILLSLIVLGGAAMSAPVDRQTALAAGSHFMQRKGLIKSTDKLEPYEGLMPTGTEKSLYIFNYYTIGFVIVSADDRCRPILGYSMNGSYDLAKAPDNMTAWMEECGSTIRAGIEANLPENKDALKAWEDLLRQTPAPTPQAKSDSYLLTSTWEQGSGYNNYCPTMNGQHVVMGCVATAMAQIIRYHGKPSRGFGHKSYRHTVYGTLAVDFDTTDYDYSLMPDRIRRSSSSSQKDMVSRLCYHCGIVVKMEYQHAGHTSGSGAHTTSVVEGLAHFGYTDAKYYSRNNMNNDSLWAAMIHEEIDNRRPIEYSGFGNDGGHAFVLDGYNEDDQYHFNWGWGGYADGFYTLTTMAGFTNSHEMVVNIFPSGWDGHLSHFLVAPDSDGDGTSWENANSNIGAAIKLNKLVERDIWLKEGTYYGDTSAQYAYSATNAATMIGGFAGTESISSQRDAANHPTIFDGQATRCLLNADVSSSSNRTLKIYDIILQNGYSISDNVVSLRGNVQANKLTLRNCQSDSGSVLYASSANIIATSIYGNNAPNICHLSGATMRQSLINNNSGNALLLNGTARVINCDIVSNHGIGALFKHPRNTFINNIVWNNESNLCFDTTLADTSFRHCAVEGDSLVADSTSIWLNSTNDHPEGPHFIAPSTLRGIEGLASSLDWHLGRGSVCIDNGERLRESLADGDFDQTIRCRNGAIDIGCYESNYPVGITPASPTGNLTLYPNPAGNHLTVTHCQNNRVQLFDITGREVMAYDIAGGTAQLDIRQLPQGVYFLKSGSVTQKFVKR